MNKLKIIIVIVVILFAIIYIPYNIGKNNAYNNVYCKPRAINNTKIIKTYFDSSLGCHYLSCEEGYKWYERLLTIGKCSEFIEMQLIIGLP